MTTISGHTTRANGTILTATIYNFDHVNHVTNAQNLNIDKLEGATPPVVDGHAVLFDGTGGAEIKSAGFAPVAGPAVSVLDNIVTFANTTGRLLKDSGVPIGQLGFGTRTNITAAATVDLGTIPSHNAVVNGNTTITSFGGSANGARPLYLVEFSGTPLLTHNATSLIIPGGQNLQMAAGDFAFVEYLTGSNWRVVHIMRNVPNRITFQTFTASGTWTKPAGVNKIIVIGTGAGGGGADVPATNNGQGAGGAGGTAIDLIDVTSIVSETVTIGAAGVGGTDANGTPGGATSFGGHFTANGGAAGITRTGGLGGTATGGIINITGGDGGNGQSADGQAGGDGGPSFWGGGGRGGPESGGDGQPGRCFGTGGGGSFHPATKGGDGAPGFVAVLELGI